MNGIPPSINSEVPRVSVIVPTFGRHEQLRRCLTAFEEMRYPRDRFEVVIADDGSDPPVAKVLEAEKFDFELKVVSQKNSGPASARNLGASCASGELLAFTDDDCVPDADWLSSLAARYQREPEVVIGGGTVNALTSNLFATASQLLVDFLYGYYHGDKGKVGAFFTSNNLALSRTAWDAVGGFDESFPLAAAEDREFSERLTRQGYPMVFERQAKVYHAHPLGLMTFLRQHYFYGLGARHLQKRRIEGGGKELRREPLSFYLGILRYPLSVPCRGNRPALAFLMGLSQLANAAGFFIYRP